MSEPEVEALIRLVFPQAVELERGACALLGMAAQAAGEAGDMAAANGINITLDAQLVADIKGLIATIEKYAQTAVQASAGDVAASQNRRAAGRLTRCPFL